MKENLQPREEDSRTEELWVERQHRAADKRQAKTRRAAERRVAEERRKERLVARRREGGGHEPEQWAQAQEEWRKEGTKYSNRRVTWQGGATAHSQ